MTKEAGGRGAALAPRSLDELRALRTDYEDVPVPDLGGTVLRLYALSGTTRALLVPRMADLASRTGDLDPVAVARVYEFQNCVVAASLGYAEQEWAGVGDALGAPTIEFLYPIATRLSNLGKESVDTEVEALGEATSAGSGTD